MKDETERKKESVRGKKVKVKRERERGKERE